MRFRFVRMVVGTPDLSISNVTLAWSVIFPRIRNFWHTSPALLVHSRLHLLSLSLARYLMRGGLAKEHGETRPPPGCTYLGSRFFGPGRLAPSKKSAKFLHFFAAFYRKFA